MSDFESPELSDYVPEENITKQSMAELAVYSNLEQEIIDLLHRWRETGFSPEAQFVTGVSDHVLRAALEGTIPSTPAGETWGFKAQPEYQNSRINYVFPIFENMDIENQLHDQARSRIDGGLPRPESWYNEELSASKLIEKAEAYALSSAILHASREFLGYELNIATTLKLAEEFVPRQKDEFLDSTVGMHNYDDPDEIEINADREIIALIRETNSAEELRERIIEVLKHRGVLVYLGKQALSAGELVFDPEDDIAMALISPMGLSKDVISGVEILTERV